MNIKIVAAVLGLGLFGATGRPTAWVRNRGLSLVQHAGPIKQLLVRHALG